MHATQITKFKIYLIFFRELIRNVQPLSFLCRPTFPVPRRCYAPHIRISLFLIEVNHVNADTQYMCVLGLYMHEISHLLSLAEMFAFISFLNISLFPLLHSYRLYSSINFPSQPLFSQFIKWHSFYNDGRFFIFLYEELCNNFPSIRKADIVIHLAFNAHQAKRGGKDDMLGIVPLCNGV